MGDFLGFDLANPRVPFDLANPNLAPRALVSLASDGTFSRASDGWYLDGSILRQVGNDVRRFEDRGGGNGAHLLLEGERTNLLTHSEDFANASWESPNSAVIPTITSNAITAPDGTQTADKVEDTDGSNAEKLDQRLTLPDTTTTYCLSVYAKKDTSQYVTVRLRTEGGGGAQKIVQFDFSTNSVVSVDGQAEEIGDGWWRLSIDVGRTAGNNTTALNEIFPTDATPSSTGSVYCWGAMLEEGAFPSSYISTTSAAATRAADSLTQSSPRAGLLAGAVTGTLYPYAASSELPASAEQWLVSVGGASNGLRLRNDAGSRKLEYLRGGSVIAARTIAYSRHQALAYTLDHAAGSLTVSGATTGDGTSTGSAGSWSTATTRYGGVQGGSSELYGRLSDIEAA